MPDKDLIERMLLNDQSAFRELVEKYQDHVIRTSLALVRNREDAEDIAQEVFIEVYRSLRQFRRESKLSTWLYRITVNKSLNVHRKNKRKEWFYDLESLFSAKKSDAGSSLPLNRESPHILMEAEERNRALDKAIDSLPENQKIAFTLHKIEELPQKEIAEIMETTVSSVESLIFRAKNNLQHKLIKYYKL
jgi:RNA polymerase sigma-70 factor, ECF subfamily